jgi:hypothetical protein|tara:strand:- start:22265 stop:22645 length:381 start_codon:yes stop_codon:yes gene_type:complete
MIPFSSIFSGITSLAGTWLEGRQKKAQLKQEVELTKLTAQKSKIEKTGEWEQSMADASSSSIKDELWTIWFIGIMTLCFFEGMHPVLKEGFRFLREDLPEFLQWGILISISASFGIKGVSSFIKKK